MNRELKEILDRIFLEGKYGIYPTLEDWLNEEGCEGRADYITKLIKDAVKE